MEDVAGGLIAFVMALVAIGLVISGIVWVITHFWLIIILILIVAAVAGIGGYVLKEKYRVWREAENYKREVHTAVRAEENAHEQIETTYRQVRDEMIQTAKQWDER